ncbi:uncharacterized protein BDR25DRAFT_396388 [Lindgomyces ingoldianus]|uniref:Uncharacterized protein n=1 Tax=Lindgomyces ingoldianus TaxID=673940 RepID=A0ACB6QE86_9PLEO|nr:uncharacterized protein BDR25DRAFT_396388 [Lindgomyces ingoldianus]KAF2465212.1 hypothetical protein BDR25DRAFT_396388 [Lindgomyces ingoldianus]
MALQKPIQALVIDTGPLIKNTVAISTVLQQAGELYTTSAILSEIRDAATRSRVETTLLPFLKVRNPTPASYEIVAQFSKKTGDFPVLSSQDLGILALAYEIECEKSGGNSKVRTTPSPKETVPPAPKNDGKRLQGRSRRNKKGATSKTQESNDATTKVVKSTATKEMPVQTVERTPVAPWAKNKSPAVSLVEKTLPTLQVSSLTIAEDTTPATNEPELAASEAYAAKSKVTSTLSPEPLGSSTNPEHFDQVLSDLKKSSPEPSHDTNPPELLRSEEELSKSETLSISASEPTKLPPNRTSSEEFPTPQIPPQGLEEVSEPSDDSDGEWITPAGISKHTAKVFGVSTKSPAEPTQMAVATMTTDFAMQNVLLQMNLNILSPNMDIIKTLRTYILRCHACFFTTKQMEKQFCPRCGQPTLTRVACSTNKNGEFKLHLAKNFQWNTRGNRYSIPKPVAGSANGKVAGGGKGAWGNELILAEDQKEYVRAIGEEKRVKARDLMDEDYLPGILTGDRGRVGGRPREEGLEWGFQNYISGCLEYYVSESTSRIPSSTLQIPISENQVL